MDLSLSMSSANDNILQNLHKLLNECADVTAQYDLRQGKFVKSNTQQRGIVDEIQSPQLLEPLPSSMLSKDRHDLKYEPIRHLSVPPADASETGTQCYILTKNSEVQCAVTITFSYVQTDEQASAVRFAALATAPSHEKLRSQSSQDNPSANGSAASSSTALLLTKLEACDHALTKKTEKYAQLKTKFNEARRFNEELLKEFTVAEQRTLEYKKEIEGLLQYKAGVEEKLIPSLTELKCTNDALTDNLRVALQDKERFMLELEQKGIEIVELQKNLRKAQNQVAELIQLHPQIILSEKTTCTQEDNMFCTNTREVLTDLDATNACIQLQRTYVSRATEIEEMQSGVGDIEGRSKGLQTKTRKLKDMDQQYYAYDTKDLVCPPLTVWTKDMCTQTNRLVLTAEEEAVLKNGGSAECTKCAKLNQRIVELEKRTSNLLQDLKLTEEERDEADHKLAVVSKKYAEKKSECTFLEKEIKSLEQSMEDCKRCAKAASESSEKYEQGIVTLKKELELRNAEIVKLAEACTALETERDNAIHIQESTQKKLESLRAIIGH